MYLSSFTNRFLLSLPGLGFCFFCFYKKAESFNIYLILSNKSMTAFHCWFILLTAWVQCHKMLWLALLQHYGTWPCSCSSIWFDHSNKLAAAPILVCDISILWENEGCVCMWVLCMWMYLSLLIMGTTYFYIYLILCSARLRLKVSCDIRHPLFLYDKVCSLWSSTFKRLFI